MPDKILNHSVVLVLSCTVVCVQENIHLSKAVVLEKEMGSANHSICAFTAVTSFIREKVNLPRKSLTVNSKHCTLSRSKKVNGTRL